MQNISLCNWDLLVPVDSSRFHTIVLQKYHILFRKLLRQDGTLTYHLGSVNVQEVTSLTSVDTTTVQRGKKIGSNRGKCVSVCK